MQIIAAQDYNQRPDEVQPRVLDPRRRHGRLDQLATSITRAAIDGLNGWAAGGSNADQPLDPMRQTMADQRMPPRAAEQTGSVQMAQADDDGIRVPGSPPPLGTGRTDVNPADEGGVDELPGNDGKTPASRQDPSVPGGGVPDIDPDQAERDGVPNPR